MNTQARFLVLLDVFSLGADVPRALLFDHDQRLLGEVIEEDGFIVGNLLRSARQCPSPFPGMLNAMVPPPSPQQPIRCFELH